MTNNPRDLLKNITAEFKRDGVDPADPQATDAWLKAQAEKIHDWNEVVVICNPSYKPSAFTDNVTGRCSECGQAVYFRPHMTGGTKICHDCAPAYMAAHPEKTQ